MMRSKVASAEVALNAPHRPRTDPIPVPALGGWRPKAAPTRHSAAPPAEVDARHAAEGPRQSGQQHAQTEALPLARGRRRTPGLGPGQLHAPVVHRPLQVDAACLGQQGPMLAGVGRKFVHGEQHIDRRLSRQADVRPVQPQAIAQPLASAFADRLLQGHSCAIAASDQLVCSGQRRQPAGEALVETFGRLGRAQGLLRDGPDRGQVVLYPMVELADQAVALRQRPLQGLDQADILQRRRRGPGEELQLEQFLGRELADFGPIGADGAQRIGGPHRRHHQAADEGGPIGVVRDAVVGIDVGDDGGLAVQHDPAGDAVLHWEPAALPQGADGVLVDVAALVSVAQHHGDPVGGARLARSGADHGGDLLDRARRGQALDGLDQGQQLPPVGGRAPARHGL